MNKTCESAERVLPSEQAHKELETNRLSLPTASPSAIDRPSVFHLRNILIPLDLSGRTRQSLDYAIPLAQHFGSHLTLLHVVAPAIYPVEMPCPPPMPWEQSQAVENELNELLHQEVPVDVEASALIRHGFLFDSILEVAREIQADLIIATTHGRTGLQHLLMGSTAENMVRSAPCPVLVLHGTEGDPV